MKQSTRVLSIVALIIGGTMAIGCCNLDDVRPAGNGTVTMTTGVTIEDNATKALEYISAYKVEKTFAAGDQIAVIYKNTSDETVKAISNALTDEDIIQSGKQSAQFTVTLVDPKPSTKVKYIYPAAMAVADVSAVEPDAEGTINYESLKNNQDGTLDKLASDFDLCTYDGLLTAAAKLPSHVNLTNGIALVQFTTKIDDTGAKDGGGWNAARYDNVTLTKMIISDGTNKYTINRPINPSSNTFYVAMLPTDSKITITGEQKTTDGTIRYVKDLAKKTLYAGTFYRVDLRLYEGALPGKFTINSSGNQVYFSQGNLQWRCTANDYGYDLDYWRFAWNQYDIIGANSNNNTLTRRSEDYMDLICWGNGGANRDVNSNFFGTYNQDLELDYSYNTDWGINKISNGGNNSPLWRTLTSSEWEYILFKRPATIAPVRYIKAYLLGTIHGIILLPDNYDGYVPTGSDWNTNINSDDWAKMEAAGAVFLPAAGERNNKDVGSVNTYGYYWTASKVEECPTSYNENFAYHAGVIYFNETYLYGEAQDGDPTKYPTNFRKKGCSIRLVKDI